MTKDDYRKADQILSTLDLEDNLDGVSVLSAAIALLLFRKVKHYRRDIWSTVATGQVTAGLKLLERDGEPK